MSAIDSTQAAAKPDSRKPSSSAVVLHNVSKHFGRFAALRQVNAKFQSGRLHVIVGENGAGKTTLLRVIAGFAQPTEGRVEVLGTDDVRRVTAKIGYMAHASLLYDELDAAGNLRYYASLYGRAHDSDWQQAMELTGLNAHSARRVGEYSQGMRQRLSLARAILHRPEILLLDEPFSNLDTDSAREIAQLLGRMRDGGKTLLVVTHQSGLLGGVADEVVRLSAGRLITPASTAPKMTVSKSEHSATVQA